MRTITIINQSTVVKDADFAAAVAACQRQVNEHFGPAWGGLVAKLFPQTAAPGATLNVPGERIYVLDDSDQQGALGYHELTQGDAPVGYVFVKTSEDAGDPWQTTLSHELLEQLADPYIDTCVEVELPHAGRASGSLFGLFSHRQGQIALVAYEVADPVENDSYPIDGVPVSNFVLPAWFQSASTPGVAGPFDYLQKLTAPLTLTPGGYISYATRLGSWQQLAARQNVRPEKYHRRGKKLRRL